MSSSRIGKEGETLEVFHDEERRCFYCEVEGHRCYVEYETRADGTLDIQRTRVDESLRGRGIAAALLRAVSAFALRERVKVIPSCSYAGKFYESHHEYDGLVLEYGG